LTCVTVFGKLPRTYECIAVKIYASRPLADSVNEGIRGVLIDEISLKFRR